MVKSKLSTDVLINGAGPSGLMLACQLALYNIPFRIIDKKYAPAKYSGAMIIHARSMEILHQMGLSVKFLKEGIIARKITLRFNHKQSVSIDIVDFGTNLSLFPYMLLLEQTKLELLLTEYLHEKGYEIDRSTTLMSFSQKNGTVTSVLKKPNGFGDILTSRFLIGAGGSTSLVRRQLQIPFHGKTYPGLLFVSDCEANIPATHAEMIFSFSRQQTLGFFPLPGNRWRIDGALGDLHKKSDDVTFDYISNYFSDNNQLNLELTEPTWFSVFRSHSRYATSFRKNNCFLIGDAAHIHSPVGAQGMNIGLQDAHNLGWKLSWYLLGVAKENLLDTYQEERLPVSLQILYNTDKAYRLVVNNSAIPRFLRLKLMPLVLKIILPWLKRDSVIRRFIFTAVSGIGVAYGKSSLSASFNKSRLLFRAPGPGDRLPCIQYSVANKVFHLQERISAKFFHLFVLGMEELPADFTKVTRKYNAIIEIEFIPLEPGTKDLFKKMVMGSYAFYLVRPDMYIAWVSEEPDASGLEKYLSRFFNNNYEAQRV